MLWLLLLLLERTEVGKCCWLCLHLWNVLLRRPKYIGAGQWWGRDTRKCATRLHIQRRLRLGGTLRFQRIHRRCWRIRFTGFAYQQIIQINIQIASLQITRPGGTDICGLCAGQRRGSICIDIVVDVVAAGDGNRLQQIVASDSSNWRQHVICKERTKIADQFGGNHKSPGIRIIKQVGVCVRVCLCERLCASNFWKNFLMGWVCGSIGSIC